MTVDVQTPAHCNGYTQSNPPAAFYPQQTLPKDVEPHAVAAVWTTSFTEYLQTTDLRPPKDVFLDESYWRDHLCFSWRFHTWHGPDEINSFHRRHQKDFQVRRVTVDDGEFVPRPKIVPVDYNGYVHGIELYIEFETDKGTGKGLVRLLHGAESQKWKAFTLYTALREIRGHPETVKNQRQLGHIYQPPGTATEFDSWRDMRIAQENFLGNLQPSVLIIGSGQAGLACGARLGQLGISCLIIDQNQRVGDCWRTRYRRLVTHDPVWYNHMPYLPFPENWPVFAPKDKLADFMESYAQIMELNIWTSTQLRQAHWDGKAWEVTLERSRCHNQGVAEVRVFRPRHIIQATGVNGTPWMPKIEGMDDFKGHRLCHSSEFTSAPPSTAAGGRKRVVVVGTGVSGHDIAQDYHEQGHAVTIVQRSPTCVDVSDYSHGQGLYSDTGPSTDAADFITHSVPLAVLKRREIEKTQELERNHHDFFEGLRRAGFAVDKGPDGAGRKFKFLAHAGGSYIDVGASSLIISGAIKIAKGPIARISPHSLILSSGIEIPAVDEIVFATGYGNMRDTTSRILGPKIAERVTDVWGIDAEGEVRGVWRWSGHKGFWFAGGNLAMCRYYSRLLALVIKGLEEGVVEYRDLEEMVGG